MGHTDTKQTTVVTATLTERYNPQTYTPDQIEQDRAMLQAVKQRTNILGSPVEAVSSWVFEGVDMGCYNGHAHEIAEAVTILNTSDAGSLGDEWHGIYRYAAHLLTKRQTPEHMLHLNDYVCMRLKAFLHAHNRGQNLKLPGLHYSAA